MLRDKQVVINEIDSSLVVQKGVFEELHQSGKTPSFSILNRYITAYRELIYKFSDRDSEYSSQAKTIVAYFVPHDLLKAVYGLQGVVESLREAYVKDYILTFRELIHASLFSDFLTQAQHLLDEGFKDASAVIIGGVLEEHLRKLCQKNGIALSVTDGKGKTKILMINDLTQELYKAKILDKVSLASVQSLGALRNEAAHGNYGKYRESDVTQGITGMRAFMQTHPA